MTFGNYGTVARSNSLNFKTPRGPHRNSSASLSISPSPEDDMDAILHNRFGSERQGSARSPGGRSGTGMGNVPVIGLGGRVPPRKVHVWTAGSYSFVHGKYPVPGRRAHASWH